METISSCEETRVEFSSYGWTWSKEDRVWMAGPIFRSGHPVACVRQVIATRRPGGQRQRQRQRHVFRCGGENMAARVMAYCLACMEAVAREEEER